MSTSLPKRRRRSSTYHPLFPYDDYEAHLRRRKVRSIIVKVKLRARARQAIARLLLAMAI